MISIIKKYVLSISCLLNNKLNKKTLTKLSKKKFIRNVFTVASGTAAAQGITMLFAPIITRLYGPEAFGVLGVFTSMVAIATPIAALTYPIAIVLPKEDSDAKGLIRLSLYIAVAMSALVALLFIFFGDTVVSVLQIQVLSPYLMLIPLVMVFASGLQVTQQWLIRKKQFAVRAKVAVAQALVVNGTKSGFGLFHPIAATLIIIATLGHALHTLMLVWGARIVRQDISSEEEQNKKHLPTPLRSLAKKYDDFPKYRAPEVFINGISQSLPVLILTAFFGPAAAGFYAIGKKVLKLPTELIGNAIGDVFYPHIASAAHNHEKIAKILKKATLSLVIVGIVPFGIVFIFGPILFQFVFGADWIVAGEYARWMALWSFFAFVNKPSVKTLPVLSEQKFHLNISVISIVARSVGLLVGAYLLQNDLVAVILYSLAGAVVNIILIAVTIHKSRHFDRGNKAK
ncbi:lipopolysaccharide biosynthesis protein [Dethiobacter alkaliphilus]|uniref:Polysaccharide biosynthesis protein n=1 Tax=Dethiobacter alkaliphilus AHT 1 TaxID=555088 RepID=C0GGQ5_DETAL|nr:oligosaccharide flippase family protein [Dethiobacter alkaliphilus]EEG77496.1 polysaccharide biosynthesis protein [Dethiobacter alkaliphilus AHT 1]